MRKQHVSELAIAGGKPAFTRKRHVGQPNIGDRERLLERINHLLDVRWLTNNGEFVREFEQQLASLTGARHCVAMANGTLGLETAIHALGLEGEVLLPSFTFVATAHALQMQGIDPVFCDIEPVNGCIDPADIEKRITPRTSAIMAVDLWGRACDVEALTDIASRHGLKLLFDSAHALGVSHQGAMVGTFGDATVFSFHATKFVNAFEGGAVTTNSDETAARLRSMINFGFTGIDTVEHLGMNAKMNEASAAMGLTSLESMDAFIDINRRNYERYLERLDDLAGVELFRFADGESGNYQYVTARIDEQRSGISRDDLVRTLWQENVLLRRYFYPGCHRMEPYRTRNPDAGKDLPETERLAREVVCFPTGQSISLEDVDRICDLLGLVIDHAGEVGALLSKDSRTSAA